MPDSTAVSSQREVGAREPLTLLCELEPWRRVFLRNLGDLIWRRELPPLEITARPLRLPPHYFIRTGIDIERFFESGAVHVVVLTLLYLGSMLPALHRTPKLESPFQNAQVEYYPVSEYLPPINTGDRGALKPRQGAPKLAKQEILSLPPEPDNNHQTIITAPKIKLKQDVPLPNIVAWTPIPAAQPVAASARPVAQLKVPQLAPQVVAPAVDASQVKPKLQLPPELMPAVVAPAADVAGLKPKTELPSLPPSVVAPVLSAEQLKLKAGEMNMAQLQPQVAAPKLPVEAQRASGANDFAAASAASAAANAGPPPDVQGAGAAKGQGQLIALGLNPADVRGPISVPNGNRSGEFHVSPSGKADAPGTPNLTGTLNGSGLGPGKGTGGGSGAGSGGPPGIMVGAPPAGAVTSAAAGTPSKFPGAGMAGDPVFAARKRMMAAAMAASLPGVRNRPPPPPVRLPEDPELSVEQRVFGKKRYYKLIMNMPNLSSATGSWIIRFAELTQNADKAPLMGPVATTKVDPAYPADAMRDRVEGTVTLYAVIRTDGTVDDVKVLNSLDSRLDANAAHALAGWRFLPGTKGGAPVALEAVVEVPFRMKKEQ
jgi:TonB family protein